MAFSRLARENVPEGDGFDGSPWAGKTTTRIPDVTVELGSQRLGRRFPLDAIASKRAEAGGVDLFDPIFRFQFLLRSKVG